MSDVIGEGRGTPLEIIYSLQNPTEVSGMNMFIETYSLLCCQPTSFITGMPKCILLYNSINQ